MDLGPNAYARWRASDLGTITERSERDLILELVGDVNCRKILDVGCGDGELAVVLAKRGANVTGIDSSGAMIEAARARAKRHGADITPQVARAEQLPFPAEQFDVVTAVTILCFVKDAGPVFREVSRVLGPGACSSSESSESGAHGPRKDAFALGWARRFGGVAGSAQPASLATWPEKWASTFKSCTVQFSIPASALLHGS